MKPADAGRRSVSIKTLEFNLSRLATIDFDKILFAIEAEYPPPARLHLPPPFRMLANR